MIVCTVCGSQNDEGESFCGECGSYLEWEGERVGPEPEPAPAPAPEPEPAPAPAAGPGLFQRVKDAVGIGTDEHPDGRHASPPDPAAPGGGPGAAPAPAAAPYAAPYAAPHAAPPAATHGGPPATHGGPAQAGELGSWTPTPAAAPAPSAPSAPAPSAPAPSASPPSASAPAPSAHPSPPPAPSPSSSPSSGADRASAPSPAPPPPAVLPTLQPPQPASPPPPPPVRAAQPTTAPRTATPVPTQQPAQQPAQQPGQPAAQPPGVAAVRPGAAAPRAPRRREVPPLDRPPAPGEQICGTCGAGNVPTRKFCRRCGTDLADAPIAAQPPWWKRIFARSPKADPAAGTRQKRRRKRGRPRGLVPLGVIIALVFAALFTRSYWMPLYDKVLDRVQGTKTVEPVSLSASSSARGHGASDLRDGATNQYWAPRGKAVGESVEAKFPSPFRLVILRVFNGAAGELKPYLRQSSPKAITVTLIRKGKGQLTKDFTLDDKPGGQELDIAEDDVLAVRITIDSVNRPSAQRLVAIGELEFLARD